MLFHELLPFDTRKLRELAAYPSRPPAKLQRQLALEWHVECGYPHIPGIQFRSCRRDHPIKPPFPYSPQRKPPPPEQHGGERSPSGRFADQKEPYREKWIQSFLLEAGPSAQTRLPGTDPQPSRRTAWPEPGRKRSACRLSAGGQAPSSATRHRCKPPRSVRPIAQFHLAAQARGFAGSVLLQLGLPQGHRPPEFDTIPSFSACPRCLN